MGERTIASMTAGNVESLAERRIAVAMIGLLIVVVGLSLIWPFDLEIGLGVVIAAIGLLGVLWAGWGMRSPASR